MPDVVRFLQQAQLQPQWCWTAVAVSTAVCFDALSTWTQCRLANEVLDVAGCCQDAAACNVPSSLTLALNRTGNHQANSPRPSAISRDDLRHEIDANRPVPVRLLNDDGISAHFVVITGYDQRADGDLDLRIQDPWGPQLVTTTYSELSAGITGRRWTHSYLTV
jgi:hypothetical protein